MLRTRLCWILSLTLLASVGAFLVAQQLEWRKFLERHAERKRTVTYEGITAERLHTLTHPGNAWDAYLSVFDELRVSGLDKDALREALSETSSAQATAMARALLAKYHGVGDRLVLAARCNRAQPQWQWGWDGPKWDVVQVGSLILALRAAQRRERGEHEAATDDIAALLQIGRDVTCAGTQDFLLLGTWLLELGLQQCRLLLKAVNDEVTLGRLHGYLSILHRQLPTWYSVVEGEVLQYGEFVLAVDSGRFPTFPSVPSSKSDPTAASRALLVKAFWQYEDISRIATGCASRQYASVEQEISGYQSVVSKEGGVLSALIRVDLAMPERALRKILAEVRLLLVAINISNPARYRNEPWPTDPFDLLPVRKREEATRVLLWSTGSDCVDNGAHGSWSDLPGQDIVLDVTR